jgi:hypothetical protein
MLAGSGGDVRFNDPTAGSAPIWDPAQPYLSKGRIRRSADFENSNGEWATIEVYAVAHQSVPVVNGHTVLTVENSRQRGGAALPKGQFQIQSEASEVAYRDVKVRSIKKIPTAITKAANL